MHGQDQTEKQVYVQSIGQKHISRFRLEEKKRFRFSSVRNTDLVSSSNWTKQTYFLTFYSAERYNQAQSEAVFLVI